MHQPLWKITSVDTRRALNPALNFSPPKKKIVFCWFIFLLNQRAETKAAFAFPLFRFVCHAQREGGRDAEEVHSFNDQCGQEILS